MVIWIKRGGLLLGGAALTMILVRSGRVELGGVAGIMNLAWLFCEKLPSPWRMRINSLVLLFNTILAAYSTSDRGVTFWSVLAAAGYLLAWNAELFLVRWPEAPRRAEWNYLKTMAGLSLLGHGVAFTALSVQGSFSLRLPWALGAMVVGLGGFCYFLSVVLKSVGPTKGTSPADRPTNPEPAASDRPREAAG